MLRFSASTLEVSAAMDALQTNAERRKRKPRLKFAFHQHGPRAAECAYQTAQTLDDISDCYFDCSSQIVLEFRSFALFLTIVAVFSTVAVEKATSDLLVGPDWTMNIEIYDSVNSNHWQPKDVVKAVKRRLQHRSSRVQLLALTLLETMVKNSGDFVHFQIAERNILEEMIKIIRKKEGMQVRDKILILLDSWQEAFGGSDGKHPQYYRAFKELKRGDLSPGKTQPSSRLLQIYIVRIELISQSGVVFPKRTPDAAAIFTPPSTHRSSRNMPAGYWMASNSSKTLDETMPTEIEILSMSRLESMRYVLYLLSDMLQAANPCDPVKEVIIDLVDRCRTNQKKLMQMLTTTGDDELLGQGLELNDITQSLLARHDAIASGASFNTVPDEAQCSLDQSNISSSSPVESIVFSDTRSQSDDEEDEFVQLLRRHSKAQPTTAKDATTGSSENSVSVNTNSKTPHLPNSSM
ncbi:hypothetical protein V8G54_020779 [Vigna mungo]|uniref:VHS domain-containing protein n=1 Tax=Vigna mungo TaxID=3915 RepID=A0AAQ3NG58_VIGMU